LLIKRRYWAYPPVFNLTHDFGLENFSEVWVADLKYNRQIGDKQLGILLRYA